MLYLVLVLFICVLIIYYIKNKESVELSKIPLVSNIPIIGCLFFLLQITQENLLQKFEETVQRFGKSFRANIFDISVIITADVRYVTAVLNSPCNLRKHKLYLLLEKWLGNGLLLSDGHKWHIMRKIITPAFHFKILENFIIIFNKQCATFINQIKQYADTNEAFDIYPYICLLTLDIITETAMGVSLEVQQNSKSEFATAVKSVTNIMSTRFLRPHLAYPFLFKIFAPKIHRQQMEGIQIMKEFTLQIIEERRRKLQTISNGNEQSEYDVGRKSCKALLDVLLQCNDLHQPLTDTQIQDEVNTFMFEGHDTSSTAISFCLYLLSRHANVQKRLYTEIYDHFGEDTTTPLTSNDLSKLKYLNCVVKESLRLYPPIPAIGRWLEHDLQLDDCTVPAGYNVIILLWELLRDPEIYPEPQVFNPLRFWDEDASKNAFSYTPFSAGPRNCIGQRFALFEIKTVIVRTLQYFELLDMGEPLRPITRIVLSSKTGVNIAIKNRIHKK